MGTQREMQIITLKFNLKSVLLFSDNSKLAYWNGNSQQISRLLLKLTRPERLRNSMSLMMNKAAFIAFIMYTTAGDRGFFQTVQYFQIPKNQNRTFTNPPT